MTALPDKRHSGCHEATEEEDDRESLGQEIWKMWTVDFRFSGRKMETAAQDGAGGDE